MEDIRPGSDAELSLRFYNDEYLYRMIRRAWEESHVETLADQYFIYTPDQLAELLEDWAEDWAEDCRENE